MYMYIRASYTELCLYDQSRRYPARSGGLRRAPHVSNRIVATRIALGPPSELKYPTCGGGLRPPPTVQYPARGGGLCPLPASALVKGRPPFRRKRTAIQPSGAASGGCGTEPVKCRDTSGGCGAEPVNCVEAGAASMRPKAARSIKHGRSPCGGGRVPAQGMQEGLRLVDSNFRPLSVTPFRPSVSLLRSVTVDAHPARFARRVPQPPYLADPAFTAVRTARRSSSPRSTSSFVIEALASHPAACRDRDEVPLPRLLFAPLSPLFKWSSFSTRTLARRIPAIVNPAFTFEASASPVAASAPPDSATTASALDDSSSPCTVASASASPLTASAPPDSTAHQVQISGIPPDSATTASALHDSSSPRPVCFSFQIVYVFLISFPRQRRMLLGDATTSGVDANVVWLPRRKVYDGLLLDAGGTLLQLARAVEETYASIAKKYGIDVGGNKIKQGFKRAFAAPWPEKLRYQLYIHSYNQQDFLISDGHGTAPNKEMLS
ncbi:hypothetical protein KSP40_PGU015442 [Platanthera guangdongensis]|uniref:Uncharacterized protein n=1 Tax=Platanthera guangdongensis TaxID=2320717 RepID=A0ABR2MKU5_9ASPA